MISRIQTSLWRDAKLSNQDIDQNTDIDTINTKIQTRFYESLSPSERTVVAVRKYFHCLTKAQFPWLIWVLVWLLISESLAMGMRYRFNHISKENEKLVTKTFTILFYRLGWSFGCSYLYPRSTSVCVERTFLLNLICFCFYVEQTDRGGLNLSHSFSMKFDLSSLFVFLAPAVYLYREEQ